MLLANIFNEQVLLTVEVELSLSESSGPPGFFAQTEINHPLKIHSTIPVNHHNRCARPQKRINCRTSLPSLFRHCLSTFNIADDLGFAWSQWLDLILDVVSKYRQTIRLLYKSKTSAARFPDTFANDRLFDVAPICCPGQVAIAFLAGRS